MNGTRALTCKYNAQLSCGRVQTPTLAMIARREQDIREFKPEDYYGITLQAGNVRWTWRDKKSGSLRTFKKERAQEIQAKAGKSSGRKVPAAFRCCSLGNWPVSPASSGGGSNG